MQNNLKSVYIEQHGDMYYASDVEDQLKVLESSIDILTETIAKRDKTIQELRATATDKFISVDMALPRLWGYYMVTRNLPEEVCLKSIAFWSGNQWCVSDKDELQVTNVTHWKSIGMEIKR